MAVITETWVFTGNVQMLGTVVVADAQLVDDYWSTTPANALTAAKQEHYWSLVYGQAGNAATETLVLHVVRGTTITIDEVVATQISANAGSSTVTIDIYKNGTTILSSVITLDSGDAAYAKVTGTISTSTGVAGDVYTAVITANQSGTDALATGVAIQLKVREPYAAV